MESESVLTKGWLAIAKLKPLSLFIPLLLMLKKAFENAKIGNIVFANFVKI